MNEISVVSLLFHIAGSGHYIFVQKSEREKARINLRNQRPVASCSPKKSRSIPDFAHASPHTMSSNISGHLTLIVHLSKSGKAITCLLSSRRLSLSPLTRLLNAETRSAKIHKVDLVIFV
ncbi:hypothetical protein AVEN_14556-1 [Araneus ventricosus]|uniref:Uncharacterized protein n=1 Tax=Araneus ventricosus TaxID=182803 RepID=A0A4Y2CGG5_ARAVE|nr:hypothetical protein AVEN_14556-1 [Araneus ventricosus]